jgi:hypothetical protein
LNITFHIIIIIIIIIIRVTHAPSPSRTHPRRRTRASAHLLSRVRPDRSSAIARAPFVRVTLSRRGLESTPRDAAAKRHVALYTNTVC